MLKIQGKYTKATVFTDLIEPEAQEQILSLCNHPMMENAVVAVMPDVHAGKGCTIGTTIKTNNKKVVPNLIGVDIGCGVYTTVFQTDGVDYKDLDCFINTHIPHGFNIREQKHENLARDVENGIEKICGMIESDRKDYYVNSVGTLGGGNHYIEIGQIAEKTYALSVHTGSRKLGLDVCQYFQKKAIKAKSQYPNQENIPDELAYIEGQSYEDYITCMLLCQEMACENRRLISSYVLKFIESNSRDYKQIYAFDTVHNYVEIDEDNIIIRKGAISAKKDQQVAIPLNMRDGVILGIGKGNKDWNESAPHGAGRLLSRAKAKKQLSVSDFEKQMSGVYTWSVNERTIDEAPDAYKPTGMIIEQVRDTIDIKAIVKPVYNFKSH